MATQSLYRRYRPRRFSELRGQEHVVKALRNAVINQREGQAYLFSGPRGTGKTSTARILAKVLNCEKPVDGEPCCECPSCISVESGTSYDVLELDAASNNGVQEIRDLIDSASLASPGRHRVFILDEVHMLSRGAEAALLKTLEEPPEHVVFVLATTDPQKVSETIRSRVQHLQFHLLPMDELEEYVRHVVADAGLEVTDEAVARVLEMGGGSARDTLSALELVAAGGGTVDEPVSVDELVEAVIVRDQGRALAAVAHAVQQGRDPRTFADDVVRHLREAFLSLMAPELVQLPQTRAETVARQGQSLGAAAVVRAMETLGQMLVEMRHAPDPRLLLDVAVVKLASPELADGIEGLLTRVQQLEDVVRQLREQGVGHQLPPAPIDPSTGRARPGSRAQGDATGPTQRPAPAPASSTSSTSAPAPAPKPRDSAPVPTSESESTSPAAPAPQSQPQPQPQSQPGGDPAALWPQVVDSLTAPLAKALFKPASVSKVEGGKVTVELANKTTVDNAKKYTEMLQNAIGKICGGTFTVTLVAAAPRDNTAPRGIPRPIVDAADGTADRTADGTGAGTPRGIVAEVAADPEAPVDPSELNAVPPSVDLLKAAFPGAQLVTDDD